MAVTYLLDTNAWIAYLRGKNPHLVRRLQSHSPQELCLCSIVLGELLYGAHHSGAANKAANLALLTQLRQRFHSLSFDDRAAEDYGEIRADLARSGTPIGPMDLQIAAIARANGLSVVTHNTSEFSRIPGLNVEDWQIP